MNERMNKRTTAKKGQLAARCPITNQEEK